MYNGQGRSLVSIFWRKNKRVLGHGTARTKRKRLPSNGRMRANAGSDASSDTGATNAGANSQLRLWQISGRRR
tara:strand:- start:428 stop:646 length:219 start_codon:yes stop_codon:yes gene_type:complete